MNDADTCHRASSSRTTIAVALLIAAGASVWMPAEGKRVRLRLDAPEAQTDSIALTHGSFVVSSDTLCDSRARGYDIRQVVFS